MSRSKKYNLRSLQKKKLNEPDSSSSSSSSSDDYSDSEEDRWETDSNEEGEGEEGETVDEFSATSGSDLTQSVSADSVKKDKPRGKKPKKNAGNDVILSVMQEVCDLLSKKHKPHKKRGDKYKTKEKQDPEDDPEDEDEDEYRDHRKRKHVKGNDQGITCFIVESKQNKKHKKETAREKEEDNKDLIDNDDDDHNDDDEEEEEDESENLAKYADYYGAEEDAEILERDENETCDSEDEKTFMSDGYVATHQEKQTTKLQTSSSSNQTSTTNATANTDTNQKTKTKTNPNTNVVEKKDIVKEYQELVNLKKVLTEQIQVTPKNKGLKKGIQECEQDIKKLVLKARHSNTVEYHRLIHTEMTRINELEYFKKRLSHAEQQKIMEDLRSINNHLYSDKPLRLSLLQSPMDYKFKALALERLNNLQNMDPADNEYHKLKHWVDNFMRIPFGVYKNVNISLADGPAKCNEFMSQAKATLDACVYGLEPAKMQVMLMLGQWIVNPSSIGSAIAIHGPPGTGKTSIVKDGISKILGRDFAFIALGGCGDSSFLEGHSYTYEGSVWGKIVQILMDCKSMNPVIYFDELDKVSETARGQEIIGILTHLTDTSQNSDFRDKYFCDVSLDLSKCLFIFSYNDASLVNPILRDRMYCIKTNGYDAKEKLVIARNYLLPKIRDQVRFEENDVIVPDDTLNYINTRDYMTKNEAGVRNLKRCLEIIHTKLNLARLVSPDSEIIKNDAAFKDIVVRFPFTVTRKEVEAFIQLREPMNPTLLAMYV